MWKLLFSKMGLTCAALVLFMIVVGVLLYKNQSLRLQIAQKDTELVQVKTELEKIQLSLDSQKKLVEERDNEIKVAKAQVVSGNKAVMEYRERMDKANSILLNAKCVPADEKWGVIDAKTNDEIIEHLNCLMYGTCDGVLPNTNKN